MNYLPTIGLEIHAELKTSSKMFCSCRNNPDEERPNTNVCPICLGHPGTLPVLNHQAIKHVLKIGLAVDGTLADFTEWDRKNYFYPDIPKGYQISQYKYPLVSGGKLSGIAIERIHLEEDTAQSTHDLEISGRENSRPSGKDISLINFNRSGVPLMELVTKPVIHDAATAVRFAKELQLLLRTLGAGEANLEKGEMRIEANISLASPADTGLGKFGTKTEVKNLTSFRSVEGATEHELSRQAALLDRGEKVVQETRGWDDTRGETYSQRSKENSHDYRYFPEPDIPKLKISEIREFSPEVLRKEIPELPWVKRDRYQKVFALTDKEVAVFVDSPVVSGYFESIISGFENDLRRIKLTSNYLLTDYLGLLKKENLSETSITRIVPADFAELISLIASGEISSRGAKDLLGLLFKGSTSNSDSTTKSTLTDSVRDLAQKHDLLQKSDSGDLTPAIDKVISENPKAVAEYKAGKVASLQFLIGQGMRATKGAGNPEIIRKILLEKLV